MAQSVFEKEYIISPDYCDAAAAMSPLAAFTIFQAMAAEHAEQIGVGGMAMAKRGEFWLTVHTRIDFFSRAAYGYGHGGNVARAMRKRSIPLLQKLQLKAGRKAHRPRQDAMGNTREWRQADALLRYGLSEGF